MSEWVNYGKTFGEFEKELVPTVGMLIEVEVSEEDDQPLWLIGDCNEMGGICDDCLGVDRREIVIRYRRVYTKEQT